MNLERMLVELSNTTTVVLQYSVDHKQWLAATPKSTVLGSVLKEAVRAIYQDAQTA